MLPRKAIRPSGSESSCCWKSATGLDLQAGIAGREGRGARPQGVPVDVQRDEALERVRERVEQEPRVPGVAGAELDQRARAGLGDVGRVRAQDLRLAARQVVLGQPGDLLVQLRPSLVVEPDRAQLLRLAQQTSRHRGHSADPGEDLPALREVPVAKARPRDKRVGRPGTAAQDAVLRLRRTLPSTRGRGTERKPGYPSKCDDVHCQTAPVACSSRAVFAAFSHSASVGRRLPAQRAYASASSKETWTTGASGSVNSWSANSAYSAFVTSARSIRNGRQIDLVRRPLVVVCAAGRSTQA